MMTLRLIVLTLSFLCATAQSQTCAGGVWDGGMDATGNQCAIEEDVPLARPTEVRVAILRLQMAEGAPVEQQTAAPASTCSGGAEGGMDATGNLCAQAAAPDDHDLIQRPRQ